MSCQLLFPCLSVFLLQLKNSNVRTLAITERTPQPMIASQGSAASDPDTTPTIEIAPLPDCVMAPPALDHETGARWLRPTKPEKARTIALGTPTPGLAPLHGPPHPTAHQATSPSPSPSRPAKASWAMFGASAVRTAIAQTSPGVCAAEGIEAKRVGKEPNWAPLLRTVAVATAGKTGTKWDFSPRVAADVVLPRRLLTASGL